MSSLKPKLFYQLAVSFLYSAAPIIIFPYISRVLGPANIGKINFIDYASQFFILMASFGVPYYGVREIARVRTQKEQLSRVTSELLIIHLLTTALSILLFGLLVIFRHDDFTEKQLILLACINIAGSAFGLEWMIHGLEDFSFLARRSFIIKILTLAAIFIFVRQSADYISYYFILIMSNILVLVIDAGYVFKQGIFLTRGKSFKKHIRPLAIFFLTSVTLSIYTFFDTVILGFIAGSLAVGFYTTSLKIIRIAHNLISDLGGVVLPRISYLRETGNHKEIGRIMNKSLQYVLTITIPLGVFLFLAAKEIIMVLGGAQFDSSVPVLQILAVLPLVIGLTNIFFIQILLPFEREKTMLAGVILGSMVSIIFNLILCPLYAEKGAAMSCVAAETVVALFLGAGALKEVRLSLSIRLIGGILLSSIIFVPVVLILRNVSSNYLVVLLLEGTACFILYALMQLFLFNNQMVKEVLHFIAGILRKRK